MNYKNHIKKWNIYYMKNKIKVPWGFNELDSHIKDFFYFYNIGCKNKVLDVGCGYGKNADIFIKNGLEYYGIDIAKEPIEFARKNIKGGNFILGDIMTFNFGKKKFDFIIDAGCIHVNSKDYIYKILDKYYKILTKNGKIFIRLFKSNKKMTTPIFFIDDYLPVWGYTKSEIIEVFSKKFFIKKIIYDDIFYEEDEVFYLYLEKSNNGFENSKYL